MADKDSLVELDAAEVLAALGRLVALGNDPAEALDDIGDAWLSRVQLGFVTSTDPWGAPWEPLKYRVGQPLRDKGHLMNSFDYRVEGDVLEIGTNYGQLPGGGSIAAVHQYGTFRAGRGRNVRIPARPMLPISEYVALPEEWAGDAVEIVVEAIEEAASARQR